MSRIPRRTTTRRPRDPKVRQYRLQLYSWWVRFVGTFPSPGPSSGMGSPRLKVTFSQFPFGSSGLNLGPGTTFQSPLRTWSGLRRRCPGHGGRVPVLQEQVGPSPRWPRKCPLVTQEGQVAASGPVGVEGVVVGQDHAPRPGSVVPVEVPCVLRPVLSRTRVSPTSLPYHSLRSDRHTRSRSGTTGVSVCTS